ncbi:hypothetical protein AHMF7616_00853 [Adhaeribacter pallidiroseus]|uniref:Uncharacterized protein n=1 Tax=Adhaeribacter pallidiroseus TaxID=2072847 RepID=A0A369QCV5_9BACT|nr:hypothetical protein AHMF7616_00853 [Adhaeribacter pallidiroseus]
MERILAGRLTGNSSKVREALLLKILKISCDSFYLQNIEAGSFYFFRNLVMVVYHLFEVTFDG